MPTSIRRRICKDCGVSGRDRHQQRHDCGRSAASRAIAVGACLGSFEAGSPATEVCGLDGAWRGWANRMSDLPRVKTAEPIIPGVLKLVFQDGYEGVVDLRPLLSKGGVFSALQDPVRFVQVKVDEFGHSVGWIGDDGYEIDLSADGLRRDCER